MPRPSWSTGSASPRRPLGRRWHRRTLAYDLTTVGDVVNTTSRLESEAAGGEISFSARMADALGQAPGEQVEVAIKGIARGTSLRADPSPGRWVRRRRPSPGGLRAVGVFEPVGDLLGPAVIAFGGALLCRQEVVRPQRTTVEDRDPLSPAPIHTG